MKMWGTIGVTVLLLNAPISTVAFVPSVSINVDSRLFSPLSHLNVISPPQLDVMNSCNVPTFISCCETSQIKSTFELETISSQALLQGVREWLVPSAYAAGKTEALAQPKPPTADEVKVLRDAFEALYGERNPIKAEVLLSQAIKAWERQPPDEQAGLYRVRGDCYAVSDITSYQYSNIYAQKHPPIC